MESIIPLAYYVVGYYYVIFLFVIVTLTTAVIDNRGPSFQIPFNRVGFNVLLLFLILYIGLRPVSGIFVDMTIYDHMFNSFRLGRAIEPTKDMGFYFFMMICAQLMSSKFFFLLCAILYIMPVAIAFKKWFPNYAYLALLFYAASFSFFAYGTNGIRSGIAASLFILALAYLNRRIFATILFVIVISFHGSMILPVIACLVSYYFDKSRIYFYIWIACIFISALVGGFWESLLANIETNDQRLQIYMDGGEAVGGVFRWDFVLYSSSAVFAGFYFTQMRGYYDPIYTRILNIYLMANSFWILIIRASFTNRFAFLSWFLLPIVIFYPFLRKTMVERQYVLTSLVLLMYFLFTYIMNVFLIDYV